MNAALIERLGGTPKMVQLPDPVRDADEQVLVEVAAAALNPIDLQIASGGHPLGPPKLPYVPAVEGAGTIVEGADVGTRVRVLVAAGFVDGAGAEIMRADRRACVPLPDDLDDITAAAIGVVGVSADLALRKADLKAGDDVLVLGANGPFGSAFLGGGGELFAGAERTGR